tara:strand:- start:4 stop:222 length:219 start_codon:yes stop_codon:yes gene_type:complete
MALFFRDVPFEDFQFLERLLGISQVGFLPIPQRFDFLDPYPLASPLNYSFIIYILSTPVNKAIKKSLTALSG